MSLCARCGLRCDTTAHMCHFAVVAPYAKTAPEPSADYARGRADALRADGEKRTADRRDAYASGHRDGMAEGAAAERARLVAAVVESQCAELGFDAPRYRASEVETAAALEAAEAVLAGGQLAPRETVGYRVRWEEDGEEQDLAWYETDSLGIEHCRDLAYEHAGRDRAWRKNVHILRLTRPVRDKSTGGG